MDKNYIIVCKDTEIDLSANHQTMAAKAATIMSIEGKSVTLSALDNGSSPSIYNKLVLQADTRFYGVNLAFSTHNIMNSSSKLILNVTGVAGGVDGCDVEIYGGQYANIGIKGKEGVGSAIIYDGKITARLEATAAMDKLNMTVLGGSIANMLPSGRNNNLAIGNLTITLGGKATINSISNTNFDANIADSTVLYANFTGSVGGTFPGFKRVGLAAIGDGSAQDADIASVSAKAAAMGLNSICIQGAVTLADGETLSEVAGITTIAGASTDAALKLTDDQYHISKNIGFQAVTLDCAGTPSKPTVIWYEGDVDELTLSGNYLLNTDKLPEPTPGDPISAIYLSGSGDDANDGSAEHPVKTLVRAYELLDAAGTMADNVIIVCGDTEIDLSSNHLTMAAKPATIQGAEGKTVTLTAKDTGTGNSVWNKLVLNADTHFKNVNFAFGTHNIMNTAGKLIMDVTGSLAGLNCNVAEIYGGSYINVEVNAENGVVTFYGGSVSKNLKATKSNCTLLIANYSAALPTGLAGFARVGVAEGVSSAPQDAALSCASSMATTLKQNTVYVQGAVTLADSTVFSSVIGKTVTGLGADAAINLSGDRYLIGEDVTFSGLALNVSTDEANPTVLQYYGDNQPNLGVTPTGYYTWKSANAPAGVYLDGTNGDDANDGSSKSNAVKTLAKAYSLLDTNKGMDENIIIVCGDTEVNLDKNPTWMPAIPATITSIDPDSGEDYKTTLKAAGTLYYKLGLKADTAFKGVKMEFGSYTIYNVSGKTIMNVIGTVSSLEASESVIYGGSYVNVYVCNNGGNGSATIYGGSVTNLANIGGQSVFEEMKLNIYGGAITNVLAGGRFSPNSSSIKELTVTLGGTPGITTMDADGTCENIIKSRLVITDFAGNASGMNVSNFDEVGVAAAEGQTTATIAALQAALQFCDAGGTIMVYDNIVADETTFPESQVTIKGDTAERTITFSKDYYVFAGSVTFDSIKLVFSNSQDKPTQLYYTESKGQPVFTTATVTGFYQFNTLADASNGLDINFGTELTKQEQEGYAPITATNSWAEFQQIISNLPDQVPTLGLFDTGANYATKIFVAANGSDETGDGTIDNPYKTPYKALEAAAAVSVLDRDKGVVIYFRAGNYKISETLTIDTSVTDILTGMPLVISAYNGEDVKFVGGETIYGSSFQIATENLIGTENWNRLDESVRGKVYVADLKALGITEYFTFKENKNGGAPILSVNNSKQTLARYPDVGEVTFKSVINSGIGGGSCVELNDLEPLTWKNTGSIYVRGAFYAEWAKEVGRITKIDSTNNSITTNKYMGWGGNELRPLYDNTHYYYNIFEELTIPGEWYLDYETGYLYIYPENGTMAATDEVNLSTSDAEYMVEFQGASNVIFSNITLENGMGGVYMTNSENVVLQQLLIQDMSSYGINIYDCFKCGAIYSTITRTGYVAFQSKASADRYKNMQPTRSFLQNCLIYETDVSATTVNGIGDIFTHNTIHHTKSMAVGVQGTECIFEFNELTSQSYDQADAGAFYFSTAGYNRGNVVRYNYIHDSNPPGTSHARGIYMDDGTCGNYAYGNIIENMEYGIYTHCGDDNVYVDNTVINCVNPITVPDAYVDIGGHPTQGGVYRYANDAKNWYATLSATQKQAWDAHFPLYPVMIQNTDVAITEYESGNHTHEAVLYAMTATGNVYKNNIIVNGKAPVIDPKAAVYTTHDGTQIVTEDDYTTRTTGSELYEKIGFADTAIVPGAALPMPSAPSLLAPAPEANEVDKKANFKWAPVKGASYYILTVAKDSGFTKDVRTVVTVLSEYTMNLPGMETDYYWKVEAVSLAKYNYNQSEVSETGHFVFTVAGDYSSTDILHYTPIVDGKRDDAYDSSTQIKLGSLLGSWPAGAPTPSEKTTAVGSLAWDENYLYVYLEVSKTGIYSNPLLDAYKEKGDSLYNTFNRFEDCIELKVNNYQVIVHADGDNYYCTMPGWEGEAPYAIIPNENGSGYSIEFAVPIDKNLEVGGKVDLHLMIDSIDGSQWENYLQIAEEYGIDKEYPDASDKRAIRATPVYQYRNDSGAAIAYTFSDKEWSETYNILNGTPVVDGIKDEEYNYSAGLTIDRMAYAIPYNDTEEIPTTGKLNMLWDENNLYYFIDVNTNGIFSNPLLDAYKKAGSALYGTFIRFEDCVQLMLTTANGVSHTTTIHADGLGYLNSANLVGTYVAVPKEDGTGYYIECAIPWGDTKIAAGQEIQLEWHVDSVDGNGQDPQHEGKTKWEVFMEYVEKYGIEETCPDTSDKRAIRRIPVYQYRQEVTTFKLSEKIAEHTKEAQWVLTETTHAKVYPCCGNTEVAEEPHEWVNGVCSECGYTCTHTGGTATCKGQAVCVNCGQSYGDKAPDNHTGEAKWTQTATTHSKTYECCGTVVVPEEAHEWTNGVCSECGYTCLHTDEETKLVDNGNGTHDVVYATCGGIKTANVTCTAKNADGDCTTAELCECGHVVTEAKSAHTGGTATCKDKAECSVCGKEYGAVNASNHTGTAVWSHTDSKHTKVYSCCGAVAVAEADHTLVNGKCECGYEAPATKPESGTVENITDEKANAAGGALDLADEHLADKLLTETEKELVKNGTDVKVQLVMEDITDTISAADLALIQAALGDSTAAMHFEITLLKQMGTIAPIEVTQTNGAVTVSFIIPEEYRNTNKNIIRTYQMLRVHDGKVDVLPVEFDDVTGEAKFETDRFSVYTLTYSDKAADNATTGDETPLVLLTALLLLSGAAAVLLVTSKKRYF